MGDLLLPVSLGLKFPSGYSRRQRIKHNKLCTIIVAPLLPCNTCLPSHSYTHAHAHTRAHAQSHTSSCFFDSLIILTHKHIYRDCKRTYAPSCLANDACKCQDVYQSFLVTWSSVSRKHIFIKGPGPKFYTGKFVYHMYSICHLD